MILKVKLLSRSTNRWLFYQILGWSPFDSQVLQNFEFCKFDLPINDDDDVTIQQLSLDDDDDEVEDSWLAARWFRLIAPPPPLADFFMLKSTGWRWWQLRSSFAVVVVGLLLLLLLVTAKFIGGSRWNILSVTRKTSDGRLSSEEVQIKICMSDL